MTADDAFLAAIIAAPTDDLPRLVYADYLDEHGDPARAEFIRVQIADARGGTGESGRAADLLAEHKSRWEIPDLRGVQTFRRGFVEALNISAAEFVAHADRIGRAAPVMAVRLSVAAGYVPDIARVAWLSRLEELDLSRNQVVGRWLGDLLSAVPLPNLRSLNIGNNNLIADAVRVVAARAAGYPHLTRLNLSATFIADEGAEVLADSPTLAGLTELILRSEEVSYDSSIHAAGAAALARSPYLTRLRRLDLAGHYIGDAGLIDLVSSLNARTLVHLDVSNNTIGELGDSGVQALVESQHLDRLTYVNLGRNTVGRLAAEALAHWPRLERVTVVDLTGCEMPELAHEILRASPHADRFRLDEPTVTV
jgi:uncharacterized protein (TIGR02996 family)